MTFNIYESGGIDSTANTLHHKRTWWISCTIWRFQWFPVPFLSWSPRAEHELWTHRNGAKREPGLEVDGTVSHMTSSSPPRCVWDVKCCTVTPSANAMLGSWALAGAISRGVYWSCACWPTLVIWLACCLAFWLAGLLAGWPSVCRCCTGPWLEY